MSELLPDGIDELRDCPHHLYDAIRTAIVALSFDELPKDERPPKRIWLDGEALHLHFETLDQRRKQDADRGAIEDPVDNDAAKSLIVG